MGYDSAYEDEEDGWSVVGDGGRCGVGAELVDMIDVVRLGALGRLGSLVETEGEDIPRDGFYDCPYDNPEFQSAVRRGGYDGRPRSTKDYTVKMQEANLYILRC